jgi:hypothetical protein
MKGTIIIRRPVSTKDGINAGIIKNPVSLKKVNKVKLKPKKP